jgi:DNA uptake protein ComE-like DNA-binding protein
MKSSRIELEKLQQLENEARLEKIGGWGIAARRLNARPERATAFSHFMPGAKVRPGATPPVNSTAHVSPTSTPSTSRPDGDQKLPRKEKTPLGKIDINTATEKELTTVPGIGHVMAARIIAARPFRSADDLRRVSGIGDKKYAQIRPYFQ